jgi:cyclic beta-1,2-glucan synthetase
MGAHDWNDGMNRVGIHGQGESIWLGWFLSATLTNFADVCELMSDHKRTEEYRSQANTILKALGANGWDGEWYRRAYYDDGSPLGSVQNNECKIDSIAQSWATLSGAAEDGRTSRAMQSVYELLVRSEDELILLFTPPFERTPRDPGYIKGYPPGIRENGGQYTHAAIWTIWAFAQLGQGDRAAELFHLINPIYHADTLEKMCRYRVEPYVIAADVYSSPPHTGRCGWTWYTGSASWMYRLGVEAILGLSRAGSILRINPCVHHDWHQYEIEYRLGKTMYHIRVENPQGANRGVSQIVMDGKVLKDSDIPLLDDEIIHEVVVTLG